MIGELTEIVDNDEGCFVNGLAGTGKTYNLNKLAEYMESKDISYARFAPTNKAALLIDGETLHKGLGIDGKKMYSTKKLQKVARNKYILIDEYSMITGEIYNMLRIIKNKYKHVRFIISGDSNQLPAIEEWDRDYENCLLLKELCDFNQKHLTENMRSDDTMFNLYHRILRAEDVKAEFKVNKLCKMNICYYRLTVDKLNHYWMERECKGKKFLRIDGVYPMKLIKGAPIVCVKNCKELEIYNNETFKVVRWSGESVEFKSDDKHKCIATKDFAELMRPAYAITGHTSQGSTFNCKYAIYDWDRIPKDVRDSWRYVAVSRTTNKDHIYINNSKQLEHIQIGRIYKITNTTNNLVYIGSTMQSSVDKRFAEHVKNCEGGAKEKLYQSMRAIGAEKFEVEQLLQKPVSSRSELLEIESGYITSHNSVSSGYNSYQSKRFC